MLKGYTPLRVGLQKVQGQVSAHVGRAVALVLLKPQRGLSDALEGRFVHQIRLCDHRLLLDLSGSRSSLDLRFSRGYCTIARYLILR